MKKIHIFDMDGTLIDSMSHIIRSILQVLDEDHVTYGPEIIEAVIPLGYPKTAELFQTMGAKGTIEEIVERFMKILHHEYANNIPLKPGVGEYLRKLKGEGKQLCVLTGSPHLLTDVCLQRNGIYDIFDHVWSVDDFGFSKDEPALFHAVARQLHCPAGDLCLYDDNLAAITTAGSIGWYTYAVKDCQSAPILTRLQRAADDYIASFETLV
jgi:HAD superfamily hydrolase (TIGR01509 family)